MKATETRYDLVFFGTDLKGAQLSDAVGRLAQVMEVSPEQVGPALNRRGGVIARGLSSERGSEACRQLMEIGIRCNLRPSSGSGAAFELVPMEESAPVIACPACGEVHRRGEAGTPAPTACEKCGVVFAKYDKVALAKKERDQVRQALLAKQQNLLDREQKDRELRETQERRKKLEDEIRRQLGLPRIITSRTGLIGSAAGIYLLGLVMGVTGLIGYNLWSASGADAAEPTALALNALAAGPDADNPFLLSGSSGPESNPFMSSALAAGQAAAESDLFDPGLVAQMQVSGLLSEEQGTIAPAVGSARTGAPSASGTPAHRSDPAEAQAHAPDGLGFLDNRLSDLKIDTEWDLYLLARIDALRERGDTLQAAMLVDHLRNPDLRFDRGAGLADSFRREGRVAEAEQLNLDLSTAADQRPDIAGARVAAFCTLARHLYRAGRPGEADALRMQATTIAAAVTGPADKAAADSEIAALLSNLGRPKDARSYFLAATRGLGPIADPTERLSAIAWLARSYAKAGYRASALSLLEEAAKNIDSIEGAEGQARVLGLIAETDGLVGDIRAAKETAARIASPIAKDRTLYRLVAAEIASDRLANAIDLTEGMQTPAYRALAFALLGLRQQEQPAYRALATRSTEQVATAIAAIPEPAEKAAVIAELGRFAARIGNTATADRHLADANRLAKSIPSRPDRDRVLAILAINEGLALRPDDARLKLPKIADAPLRLAVTGDLMGLEEAARGADR